MSFKIPLTCRSSPPEVFSQRCSPRGGCYADVLRIFWGVSLRGYDFNKVAKRFCWDHASALLFSCWLVSCLQSIFLEKTSGRLILCTIFNLYWFFLINYTFEDFKVSILINFNWFLLIAVLVFVRCFLRFLLYWRSFCKESEIFYSKIDYRDV